ncbi:VOC family protein [Jatrophihabitans sp.]|uniref:VOC family protein n=1 Tax=Jatrophihabitans sp. TaxID=1932789 RepID=UPI0030C67523|nr:Lactoylglutathione lyase-related lyase [Jatrophihabitans sp.]
MPPRLDHITVTAGDFATSLAFYDATLGALGWVRSLELGDEEEDDPAVEVAGWGPPDEPVALWLVTGAVATRGLHVALAVGAVDAVERMYAAALASGGVGHDAPRRWPIIRRGEFNAIVADPDGNLIEAVAPEA